MAIQEWEYCALFLGFINWLEYEEIKKQGWICELRISYISKDIYHETLSILQDA
jgi:hypothetical protein